MECEDDDMARYISVFIQDWCRARKRPKEQKSAVNAHATYLAFRAIRTREKLCGAAHRDRARVGSVHHGNQRQSGLINTKWPMSYVRQA